MVESCTVSFPGTEYLPLQLPPHQNLSEHLTVQNSPVLFGCRTGICGTCLVIAIGNLPPADRAEQEVLDLLAPDIANARLACQLNLTADVAIERLNAP